MVSHNSCINSTLCSFYFLPLFIYKYCHNFFINIKVLFLPFSKGVPVGGGIRTIVLIHPSFVTLQSTSFAKGRNSSYTSTLSISFIFSLSSVYIFLVSISNFSPVYPTSSSHFGQKSCSHVTYPCLGQIENVGEIVIYGSW